MKNELLVKWGREGGKGNLISIHRRSVDLSWKCRKGKISQWKQVHRRSPESWCFRDKQARLEFRMPGPHMVCKPLDSSWESGWPYGVARVPSHSVDSVPRKKKRQHYWKIVSAVDAGENWVLWKKISLASPRPPRPLSARHRPTERFASSWKARIKCFLQTPNSPAAVYLVALSVVSWLLRIRLVLASTSVLISTCRVENFFEGLGLKEKGCRPWSTEEPALRGCRGTKSAPHICGCFRGVLW